MERFHVILFKFITFLIEARARARNYCPESLASCVSLLLYAICPANDVTPINSRYKCPIDMYAQNNVF